MENANCTVTVKHKGLVIEVNLKRILTYSENGETAKEIARGCGLSASQARKIIKVARRYYGEKSTVYES